MDRAWFQKGRFRGAEDWARARAGHYEANSPRSQYSDRLHVGTDGQAVELVLYSSEVRKLARGLALMLAAAERYADTTET
jgi:RNA:NAD 2'-phosphotransferase (TPT1/KptA family)